MTNAVAIPGTRPMVRTAHPLIPAIICLLLLVQASATLRITTAPQHHHQEREEEEMGMTLERIREELTGLEDTIIFGLIERSKFRSNSIMYQKHFPFKTACFAGDSLAQFVSRQTEAAQAKAGLLDDPTRKPFFPETSHPVPVYKFPEYLNAAASASINVNKQIWDIYFNKVLPQIVAEGDDGNYASAASSDFAVLQALSKRVHLGEAVAEVKFRSAPTNYTPAILAQDKDALMKLLTFVKQEETVKERAEKKAMVFGQQVGVDNSSSTSSNNTYKVPPAVVASLYGDYVIPLTKDVEVMYLLKLPVK